MNRAVELSFAVGSWFKGSIRDGLNGAVADFAAGSRFKGSIREGLNGAVEPGVGDTCAGRLAEGVGGRWAW